MDLRDLSTSKSAGLSSVGLYAGGLAGTVNDAGRKPLQLFSLEFGGLDLILLLADPPRLLIVLTETALDIAPSCGRRFPARVIVLRLRNGALFVVCGSDIELARCTLSIMPFVLL